MSAQVFNLPDVGEGLTEAEIVSWHVEPGQTVAVNDPLVDIETAKSTVELPSPYAGVVELLAEAGQLIEVGTPIVRIVSADEAGTGPADDASAGALSTAGDVPTTPSPELDGAPAASQELREKGAPIDESAAGAGEPEERPQVLVGPGPKAAGARRRRLSAVVAAAGDEDTDQRSAPPGQSAAPPLEPTVVPAPSVRRRPQAKPPVRLLARRLGVDLQALDVVGAITRADVERAAAQLSASGAGAGSPLVDKRSLATPAGRAERERRVPVKGIRKATAQAMVRSAFTAPHVTEWLAVDMTDTMQLVRELKADRAWAGVRVNPLLFVARAFLIAVRTFPEINASWDEATHEIVYKDYVNLGIAAATPRGLLVPNIKDADAMDLRTLSNALDDLVATARAGKTQPAEMANGTVTITNIGALGVDAGTPILNPGESAILAFGAVRPQPWVVDGQICVREVTQLAMSFDHRLVDGELGSHVLARTGEVLGDPRRALLYL
ncbi:MAG: 2-oxo acid dehydrogenase subunit [Frankiales bacterium]|nr:2-oxo acid dehydrogenase subunit [Frankiales bacterium]